MSKHRLSNEEIARRGEELYDHSIRDTVEAVDGNIGKIIVLDVDSGEYEIDDVGLAAAHRLKERRPDAQLYAMRIGYDAVYNLVEVLAAGGEALLGTSLLDDHEVNIQFADGGSVTIEPL